MKCFMRVFLAHRSKPEAWICRACGEPGSLHFTEGKGHPYFACRKHVVHALLPSAKKAGGGLKGRRSA